VNHHSALPINSLYLPELICAGTCFPRTHPKRKRRTRGTVTFGVRSSDVVRCSIPRQYLTCFRGRVIIRALGRCLLFSFYFCSCFLLSTWSRIQVSSSLGPHPFAEIFRPGIGRVGCARLCTTRDLQLVCVCVCRFTVGILILHAPAGVTTGDVGFSRRSALRGLRWFWRCALVHQPAAEQLAATRPQPAPSPRREGRFDGQRP
jgi:hypothetical protein